MSIRRLAFVGVIAAALIVPGAASALEARETRSQVILDVSNTWVVARQGEFVRAHPPSRTAHGPYQDAEAEKFLLTLVLTGAGRPVQQLHVDTHARAIDWGNFTGFEVFGTGRMGNDNDGGFAPAKWVALVLVDKTNPKKGLYAVGVGSPAGYDANEPPVYTAFHALRSY